MLERLRQREFDILALHHAEAVLTHEMPQVLVDIENVLAGLTIPIAELIAGGGGEAKLTQRLRKALADLGWRKRKIKIKKIIDGVEVSSISHEIDHVKKFGVYAVAMEIEWNNKDPFYDRDLDSFQRLHAEGAISVGVIITRGQSFQAEIGRLLRQFCEANRIERIDDLRPHGYNPTARQRSGIAARLSAGASFVDAFAPIFVADKFGEATTHWRKLEDRVRRGVGNPCPLLLIGIPISLVV